MISSSERQQSTDFSVVLGGPLFQLLRRAHLTGNALELTRRRMLVISLFAWLPLAVLSAINGELFAGTTALSFLRDIEVHVRFLVAVPLLIAAELIVHDRMRSVVNQFLARDLIPPSARPRFDAAVASVFRLRDSVFAELLLIVFVYGFGLYVVWHLHVGFEIGSWSTVPAVAGTTISQAGIWYTYVSMPIFQFLLLRWYFRVFIWTRFLWQVSRLDLSLIPMHPDRLGGLGFLANTAFAFVPIAVAHGAVLSGAIANRIFQLGSSLPEFKAEIAVVVVFVQCLVFVPLLMFSIQLARAKRIGLREYGGLAQRYVREFDAKWLRGGAADEPLMGSADIQSLADLGNSFEVVKGMRFAPITRDAVVQLAVATLLPLAPLLLTVMPLEELIRRLIGTVF